MSLFALVVPTLNPGQRWRNWLEAVAAQSVSPKQLIVIDSGSIDGYVFEARDYGFEILSINQSEFNHGGTRQQAVNLLNENIELVVFLTQDAILAKSNALQKLISAFENLDVSAAFGRQLPHKNAGPFGAHARYFNYAPESSLRSFNSIQKLGFKTCFISNSFAAYRIRDLLTVGGFPTDVILGEDTYVASQLILSGKKVAYVADACVYHSHDYTSFEEFRRYFDTGVLHAQKPQLLEKFKKIHGEGAKFVASEVKYLAKNAPWLIPLALSRSLIKFLGYELGKCYEWFPQKLNLFLSMHKGFWKEKCEPQNNVDNLPKILMILSRPYVEEPVNGREKINKFVYNALSEVAYVRREQFHHLFNTHSSAMALFKVGFRFLHGLWRRGYSFQALLFSNDREIERIINIVDSFNPHAVYVESVRSAFLIDEIRSRWPNLRIVCDFDDLMSRRMREWRMHNAELSLGYISEYVPKVIKKCLAGALGDFVCRYEAATLEILEQKMLSCCDSVVLLSSSEFELLKSQSPEKLHSKIMLIPPTCDPLSVCKPEHPLRFVFIGSDALLQNRLSIEYLLNIWRRINPLSPLVIYGRMKNVYTHLPPNVKFAGFVQSLADVYSANSIVLAPSFVMGGVKTKVLEAMEFGNLVVGNATSFEGIVDVTEYPILNNEDRFLALIKNPTGQLNECLDVAQKIVQRVRETHSRSIVSKRWQATLLSESVARTTLKRMPNL